MRNVRSIVTGCLLPLLIMASGLVAGQRPTRGAGSEQSEPNVLEAVTLAVVDFEASAPGNPELGKQLADVLTARLGIYDQFRLVERGQLQDVLAELQLNLSGLVQEGQTTKVGRLVGARLLVFGRAFAVDQDLYMVAKVVGTETGRVKGVIASGPLEGHLSDIIGALVDKLQSGLEEWAGDLLPETERLERRVERLTRRLADRELPTVAVIVTEEHASRRLPDPAAATEVKRVLREIGFTVIEADRQTLDRWTRNVNMADADVVISGEGLSEFGAQLGGLVSCVARLEAQVIWKETGEVIAAERTTRRAVDLSENIAAKTALQAAGHEMAVTLATSLAEELLTD